MTCDDERQPGTPLHPASARDQADAQHSGPNWALGVQNHEYNCGSSCKTIWETILSNLDSPSAFRNAVRGGVRPGK